MRQNVSVVIYSSVYIKGDKMKIEMNWAGGMKFESTSAFGHKISTDASEEQGGKSEGYKPTELILYGIAGCTGIDIVRLMKKQRQEMTSLKIEVIAHQRDDYPKPFHTFEIKFIAKGKNLEEKRLQKAINMSEEKYCVVSQTMQEKAVITTSYEIIEE